MSTFGTLISGALSSVRRVAGESVTYRRGDDITIQIEKATPLGGSRPQDEEEGAYLKSEELDWGIAREDLVYQPVPGPEIELRPAEGDLIVWEKYVNGVYETLTYGVLPRDDHQCFRWSDRGQTQYRIYTTLLSRS